MSGASRGPDVPSDAVRLALVGCGDAAWAHLDAILAEQPRRFVVTCLVDSVTDRRHALNKRVVQTMSEIPGFRYPLVFASVHEALAEDPTQELFAAVSVACPSEMAAGVENIQASVTATGRHMLVHDDDVVAASNANSTSPAAVPSSEPGPATSVCNEAWYGRAMQTLFLSFADRIRSSGSTGDTFAEGAAEAVVGDVGGSSDEISALFTEGQSVVMYSRMSGVQSATISVFGSSCSMGQKSDSTTAPTQEVQVQQEQEQQQQQKQEQEQQALPKLVTRRSLGMRSASVGEDDSPRNTAADPNDAHAVQSSTGDLGSQQPLPRSLSAVNEDADGECAAGTITEPIAGSWATPLVAGVGFSIFLAFLYNRLRQK